MSVGYKIEIVLFAIAVLLIGSIFIVSKTETTQPKVFVSASQSHQKDATTTKVYIKININTANLEELTVLDGIGPVTAEKIIEYRKSKPFEKLEDIMNVSGIGEKKFEAIKNHITVK